MEPQEPQLPQGSGKRAGRPGSWGKVVGALNAVDKHNDRMDEISDENGSPSLWGDKTHKDFRDTVGKRNAARKGAVEGAVEVSQRDPSHGSPADVAARAKKIQERKAGASGRRDERLMRLPDEEFDKYNKPYAERKAAARNRS